jgi:hypothetical protein
MIRHISIIVLLAFSSGLYAQNQSFVPSKAFAQKGDSLKVKKPRTLKEWTLSADYSEEVNVPFDTVFSLCNRFKRADSYSPVNATLGNYGLPFYQLSFFDRITDPDKFLYSYYYPLMHLPSNALFMNTQVPYTELDWSFSPPRETSEQTFRVRHSQNVNRFLNFGLIYDIVYDLGQYKYQRAEDKNFTFYSSYTGNKYKLYFSLGLNSLVAFENGGIVNFNDLKTVLNTRDIPVNLGGVNNAKSTLKNRNLLLVQRYTIGSSTNGKNDSISQRDKGISGLSGTFSHILTIESTRRSYYDSYPQSGFYDTIYNISSKNTRDSLYSRIIKNTLRFDFSTSATRKFRLGGGIGIRNELFLYNQVIPTHILPMVDSTSSEVGEWKRSNNVLIGKLYNNIGDKFRWLATGELYFTGYKSGDFNLIGEISKTFDLKKGRAFWLIDGSMMNRQPSFWYERWGSNNFEWNNNFKKEFRVDVGTTFKMPARKTELKFNYAIITNYTDFDSTALPSQYTGGLSVAAITLNNELRLWKFHLATDVIVQKSSNSSILDLPLATIRSAAFFEHLFKFPKTGGKLNTQLGVDITYNTSYHAYAYMPATGRFYRQEIVTAGNYPYINAFLNIKIKRTRFFVMIDHLNSKVMNESIRYNYYMVPDYPMNIRMFRYGLSWTFYN